MNKTEMAKRLGVSRQSIYDWERDGSLQSRLDALPGVPGPKRDRDAEHARLMSFLAKEYPDTPVIRGDDLPAVEFVPTGIPRLDHVLGGGVAKGRIFYVYGRFGVGKTTLAMTVAREFMKVGRVAYLDSEHAVSEKYSRQLGVDMDRLEFLQPVYLDECIGLVRNLCESGLYSLIVLDSVAAARYRPEKDGEVGDANMGWRGKIMNQAMRLINASAYRTGTSVMIVNQRRDVMGGPNKGVKYQPGGTAIEYAASQMLEMNSMSNALDKSKRGRNIRIACFKNKVGNPFRDDVFRLEHGKGFLDAWSKDYEKDSDDDLQLNKTADEKDNKGA